MVQRVIDILFKPKETWLRMKGEPTTFGQVLTGYAIPLAVIPALFSMLGYVLIGIRPGLGYLVFRIPFFVALVWAIVYFIILLVGLYVEGIVINTLAPSFSSKQNSLNAFKLAVYAATPAFVAGILNIVPALGIIVFLCFLYGLYLMYLGLPILMETPQEKVVGYLVVTIIVMIVIYIIVGLISGAVLTAIWRPVF